MKHLYEQTKVDVANQLNTANNASVDPDHFTIEARQLESRSTKFAVGDGINEFGEVDIGYKQRLATALMSRATLLIKDGSYATDPLLGSEFIGLLNDKSGLNISEDEVDASFWNSPVGSGFALDPDTFPMIKVPVTGRVTLSTQGWAILAKKDYNMDDWLTDNLRPTGADDDLVYSLDFHNTCGGVISGQGWATNVVINFINANTLGSPIYYLRLNDADMYAITWPSNLTWIDADIRNFDPSDIKNYIFVSFDNGVSFYGYQLPSNLNYPEAYHDILKKIQRLSIDDGQVQRLLDGHTYFLAENTGKIVDPHTDHFVINEKGVIVNNRHFTYNTRQEGQPDSDATTEGHSLLIVGYLEAYKRANARGDTIRSAFYLDQATMYFNAYIAAFYGGVQPPEVPGRWQANWIVNGKAPVLAHYPLAASSDFPTHGGFIDIPVLFEDGVGQISDGAPYWGEYLDVVGKVYTGKMGWQRIDATPYLLNAGGGLDWDSKGTVYPVDYICTWSFEKISGTGENLGIVGDVTAKGTIALKDKTFNGNLNVSFAVRLPVEHGGYLIATNECQHNRPLQVPVNNLYRGNASDAEQWFCEAAYDLWKITGEEMYKQAFEASRWTIMEYTAIDSNDKFFRSVKGDTRYDTDGISYYYTYPSSQPVVFGRNADGNITIHSDRADGLQITLEQNALPFRVNRESVLLVTYGGKDDNGGAVNMRSQLELSIDKSDAAKKTYTIPLTATSSDEMTVLRIPIGSLVEIKADDLFELLYASNVSWSENATIVQKFEDNVLDGRTAPVMSITGTDAGDLQLSVSLSKKIAVTSVIYKSAIDMNIRIIDADGWRWWAMMDTSAEWKEVDYTNASWTLSGYQTNPDETPRPDVINWGEGVDEVTFLPDGSSAAGDIVEIYSLNGVPTTYAVDDGYTMLFNITFYLDAPGTVLLGDCTIQGQRLDPLPYTPGIIPFSNNSVPDAPTFDSWRGQPYPGYQYPFFYPYQTDEENPNRDLMISNVIDFWWDSQQWYNQQFGVLGPGASAYVWDRWDMPSGETPNTWTMYHFGDSEAWSGYQPRAFYGAVRMYEAMQDAGRTIPVKLTEYITNWLTYLSDFVKTNKIVPTVYPMTTKPVPVENDFTGHMSGLYLAGVCKAYMLGIHIPGHLSLARGIYDEIVANYVQRPGYPDKMNGSWSPFADPSNNGKDGMFFGFWAGEIMRGLSLYSTYMSKL